MKTYLERKVLMVQQLHPSLCPFPSTLRPTRAQPRLKEEKERGEDRKGDDVLFLFVLGGDPARGRVLMEMTA